MEFLDSTFYHNSARQWLIALGVALGAYAALRIVLLIVRWRLARVLSRTHAGWGHVIVQALSRTKGLFLLLLAVYAGVAILELPVGARAVIGGVAILGLLFQTGLWLSGALGAWVEGYSQREMATDRGRATTARAMAFIARLALWSVLALVALDNFGVEITTLVAGLGVGGVAVALAMQNILGDLFASLSIVLDKPFVLGDFIIVDNHLGSVEYIGFKTTRIRSLWGEQVVFSNSDLLRSRLRNFGRMTQRRVAFEIGVTYQTPRDKLVRIPQIIREAIVAQQRTGFDRAHFKTYGDFALKFEAVYYVLGPDYNLYMDIQQAINLAIHERFEQENIEFAYPTQTLFVTRPSE